MKYIAVKEPTDPILYRAVLDKFKALGYRIYKYTDERDPDMSNQPIGFSIDYGSVQGLASSYPTTHSLDDFFNLQPEDVQEAKEMTVKEIEKALGYKVKIVKG